MAIIEKFVEIFGAKGGPNDDSAPIYGDNKAPNGSWAYNPKGGQLMWPNGMKLVCVRPESLSSADSPSNFVQYDNAGVVKYIRVWVFDPETRQGVDYQPGTQTWIEYNKLQEFQLDPDEPVDPVDPDDPGDVEITTGTMLISKISFKGITVLFDEPIEIEFDIE